MGPDLSPDGAVDSFRALRDDDPVRGLLFVEVSDWPGAEGARATGMAYLIGEAGLVATCSHVLTWLKRFPGSALTLHAASPEIPISLDAEVLVKGWRGPDWREWAELGKEMQYENLPPEAFQEDIAFLRLLPDTARFHDGRARPVAVDAKARLYELLRVLPLAAPGYGPGVHPELKGWHVFWTKRGPDARSAPASFLYPEKGMLGCIRIQGKDIIQGYSGSPLWDGERRRVVGMVRRGIMATVDGGVLAVDARQVGAFGGVDLIPDRIAQSVIGALHGAAEMLAPMRHFPLLRTLLPPHLLDLRARIATPRDPLEFGVTEPARTSALALVDAALEHDRVVVLSGGAGAGKSTLLFALASRLMAQPRFAAGRRLLPMYISALDFQRSGFDIDKLLRQQCQDHAFAPPPGLVLAEALDLNDLSLVLFVDGLDELTMSERATVIGRLRGLDDTARTARAVLTTRPLDDIRFGPDGRTVQGWPVLELEALDAEEVATLGATWFADDDGRKAFSALLRDLTWDRRGPSPLQVTAAASLFQSKGGMPERTVELPFALATHFLQLGRDEDEERQKRKRSYRSATGKICADEHNLRNLLGHLADATIAGVSGKGAIADRLAQVQDEPWSGDVDGVIDFLEKETRLLGGILGWEQLDDGDARIRWPHRTIVEALAAEHIARRVRYKPLEGLKQIQAALRQQGQGFAVTVMAAMDDKAGGAEAVERALSRALKSGSFDYKSTLFAVRALGAGIRTSTDLRDRLTRTLVALLLLPATARMGISSCQQLFSTDDLPDPVEIAKRPEIRASVVRQLHERWRHRTPRRRPGQPPPREGQPITISKREAELLDRLAMWSDITIPIQRPVLERKASSRLSEDCSELRSAGAGSGTIVSTALLANAVRRLQDDADGFLGGFVEYLEGPGASLPSEVAARAYVESLLRDTLSRGDEPSGPDPTPAS